MSVEAEIKPKTAPMTEQREAPKSPASPPVDDGEQHDAHVKAYRDHQRATETKT